MTVKVYRYISNTKVNVLYHQIPKGLLSKIAIKLKVKLPLLDVELTKDSSDNMRYQKCKTVVEYLEKEESIGSIDNPQLYFKGTLNMKWGHAGNTLFFMGITDHSYIDLVGSLKHHVGLSGTGKTIEDVFSQSSLVAFSHLFGNFNADIFTSFGEVILSKELTTDQLKNVGAYEILAHNIEERYSPPFQKLDFYAIRLLQEEILETKRDLILGSYIYVALL